MTLAAIAIDLALLGAIRLGQHAWRNARTPAVATRPGVPAVPASPLDAATPPPWAMCMSGEGGEPPATVAITYLDSTRDDGVNAPEIRGWFGDLPPSAIQVWRLEENSGRRRISFELPATAWPRWREITAGLAATAQCDALHRELRAHQVGRPRPQAALTAMDRETRSRHDLEFLFARRARLYRDRVQMGTLADLTQPRLDELRRWLDDVPGVAP